MTNEQIQQWAREAGIGWASGLGGMDEFLQAFATLVRNAAIEDAALKAIAAMPNHPDLGDVCAKEIRSLK